MEEKLAPETAIASDAHAHTLRTEATFTFFATLFAVVLVLTNIIGVKLFHLFPGGRPDWMPGEGPLTLTSGIITYPLTFLLTDVVSEIWGRRRADFMVVLGFVMSLFMLAVVLAARALPPSEVWTNPTFGFADAADMQRAFDANFAYPGVLLFSSMLAYLVSQLIDVRLYHFWWRVTRGGHMWVRNNGSTMISQLVDTVIVNSIFLRVAYRMNWPAILEVIVAVYLCKLVMALGDTPLVYLARAGLRRFFGLAAERTPRRAPLA